jgi:hypothetical protein
LYFASAEIPVSEDVKKQQRAERFKKELGGNAAALATDAQAK